jgi:hypothetical protein
MTDANLAQASNGKILKCNNGIALITKIFFHTGELCIIVLRRRKIPV